jgi:DNA-directed RNA polymerase sigma subunit (sigma70/sigma32)
MWDEEDRWIIQAAHRHDHLGVLTPRQREAFLLRYDADGCEVVRPEEIAGLMGLTRERIRQLDFAAMRKLRHREWFYEWWHRGLLFHEDDSDGR